ncbi:hypothetical protein [Macrococcus armenti]|uniref:DUF4760 domain-containing protein n=1 Tax=Macrococcus armenti TaxID=2875764 RepID=A0ABY3ZX61_9STAP|nr:hypothetical protein [Macrococcus armenti]UOB21500.1 hypothetical protein MRZ06_05300 [Macrococcus armenti]
MCIIEFIDNHKWIANIIAIFVSAGVAIYVMNKNHQDARKMYAEDKRNSDSLTLIGIFQRFTQIDILATKLCKPEYQTSEKTLDEKNKKYMSILIEEIIELAKANNEEKLYFKNEESTNNLFATIEIINESRLYLFFLKEGKLNNEKLKERDMYVLGQFILKYVGMVKESLGDTEI